ncbi:hypothetical protein BA895_15545 [Humibacillus sp. DSM 29435]|uniref:hypothetical protein n=1 Tax=Humibacillus sp. DSM 29435 TaxID=1869167 RepID=UPI00087279D1|nr:hypothetical protein [Humibacillus sp. DSM 29435]OFE17648.1 hypothetical protein BA895_15545 [Humibacillus sp. DSM 29435]
MRRRVWWIGGSAVLLILVMAVASGVARLKTAEEYSTQITPLYVLAPEERADQRSLMVVFPWHATGYCVGQALITATESSTEVVVSQVKVRTIGPNEGCAGVGTDGLTTGDYLQLEAPLGNRTVTRAQDGVKLEVRKS